MINQASDSDSEEEVPPPLPPPRTESLKKEVIVVYNISKTVSCLDIFVQCTIVCNFMMTPTRWLWLGTAL